MVDGKPLGQPLASQAQVLVENYIRVFSRISLLSCPADLISLSLRSHSLLIPCIYDLDLVFLSRNCHLVNIALSLFEYTFHAEERLSKIGLEKSINFSKDFFNLLYFETKNIPAREFTSFQHKRSSIFALSDTDTLDLDPGKTHIKVLTELCKPNHPAVGDDESA